MNIEYIRSLESPFPGRTFISIYAPKAPVHLINQQIKSMVDSSKIFIFMKGTPDYPQCGFSNSVVQIIRRLGKEFNSFDVLSDPTIRQGIKDFSNWPTIPQLYVKGEFVGGCDIIREMYQQGELQQLLQEKGLAGGTAVA